MASRISIRGFRLLEWGFFIISEDLLGIDASLMTSCASSPALMAICPGHKFYLTIFAFTSRLCYLELSSYTNRF